MEKSREFSCQEMNFKTAELKVNSIDSVQTAPIFLPGNEF